ncbi:MAG TPA: mercuric transport protein, partial [Rhodocyclaceae bacterium]|nr:mercuric transport protein [Rhodocyclaceae bacterium]
AVLKPFVGLFTVVALVALGAAGYLVFRPAAAGSACDSADRACASDRVCRNTRRAFLGCALFIAALLLFPYAAPLFY